MKLGKLLIKKSDDKLDVKEIRRNVRVFSWVWFLFVVAVGVFIGWRFYLIGIYVATFVSVFGSLIVGYLVKNIVYNISIRKARAKYGDLLKDVVEIKVRKRVLFAMSGLTFFTAVALFIVFILLIIPNVDIVEADNVVLGAHRGSSKKFIENTLPAFEDAVNDSQYKFIEFDVQYTADNVMVVHHDRTLNRLQDIDKRIENLNYSELMNISKYHIPTYDEVMDLVAGKKPLNIEIKSNGDLIEDQEMADRIINDARERGVFESTLFSSVSTDVVKYMGWVYPEADVGKVYYVNPSSFLSFKLFIAETYKDVDIMGADYIMLHASNIKNYNRLKRIKPEDKTLVFWYFTDKMYIVEPQEKSWYFVFGKENIEAAKSPKEKEICLWWCD